MLGCTAKFTPEAGTGRFAGMTRNISIHGSAAFFGNEPTTDDPWLWTAKMTGSVCKAKQAIRNSRRRAAFEPFAGGDLQIVVPGRPNA